MLLSVGIRLWVRVESVPVTVRFGTISLCHSGSDVFMARDYEWEIKHDSERIPTLRNKL